MNIAVIFAGGIGSRMKTKDGTPKQFLEIEGVPILVHTLRNFQDHGEIDKIVVVMKDGYLDRAKGLIDKYDISKVEKLVVGGETGQESIYHGLLAAKELSEDENDIVLIHDGVRPFIDGNLISENIECVKKHGSAISCVKTTETFLVTDDEGKVKEIPVRDRSLVAKAPQSFYLKIILEAHEKTLAEGIHDSIDSCTLMYRYDQDLAVVMTDYDNIKITTPKDMSLAESIYRKRKEDV
ncbi:2-C-methyl-D-erythritol 4-phosphate cytidylyltransferase [Candidatus Saccharibacteria bacterium]|nr:2-C-methyl-D-erythritol 4-phosphate cytidylyltransferase [Candidatus Saccharibacteria bacterium]